jgi:hypothetical protein
MHEPESKFRSVRPTDTEQNEAEDGQDTDGTELDPLTGELTASELDYVNDL